MAETINGLYKAEVIEHEGPWQGKKDVEFATLDWVHWFNTERRDMDPSDTSHHSKLKGTSMTA